MNKHEPSDITPYGTIDCYYDSNGQEIHYECGGEVWTFKGGRICNKCHAQEELPE